MSLEELDYCHSSHIHQVPTKINYVENKNNTKNDNEDGDDDDDDDFIYICYYTESHIFPHEGM